MSIEKVIEQLESLSQHCELMQKYTSHRPWCDDVRALNIAIDIIKKYDYALNIRKESFEHGKK